MTEVTTAASNAATGSWGDIWLKHAKEEEKSARWWRRATIAVLTVTVALAVFGAFWLYSDDDNFRADHAIGKVVLVAAFGGLAAYLARQSTVHLNTAHYSRQLGNDLQVLPLFIADLPPEIQAEIKKHVAISRFAQPLTLPTSAGDANPAALGNVQAIIDAARGR